MGHTVLELYVFAPSKAVTRPDRHDIFQDAYKWLAGQLT